MTMMQMVVIDGDCEMMVRLGYARMTRARAHEVADSNQQDQQIFGPKMSQTETRTIAFLGQKLEAVHRSPCFAPVLLQVFPSLRMPRLLEKRYFQTQGAGAVTTGVKLLKKLRNLLVPWPQSQKVSKSLAKAYPNLNYQPMSFLHPVLWS